MDRFTATAASTESKKRRIDIDKTNNETKRIEAEEAYTIIITAIKQEVENGKFECIVGCNVKKCEQFLKEDGFQVSKRKPNCSECYWVICDGCIKNGYIVTWPK